MARAAPSVCYVFHLVTAGPGQPSEHIEYILYGSISSLGLTFIQQNISQFLEA